MPHTHYTTLISAANLHERLTAAPGSVLSMPVSMMPPVFQPRAA